MPDAAPARERLGPYAAILAVGLLAAAGIALSADRDTFAWTVPVLALTAVLLAVVRLSDGRAEEHDLERIARDLGLRHQRARTLPPVTPVLQAVRGTRTVQALEGDLVPGGPPVRLARVRVGRVPLAVCLTDLPGHPAALADPHALLRGADVGAPAFGEDPAVAAWLGEQRTPLGYATGDDALVTFAAAGEGVDAALGTLLEATRQLHPRLTGQA